MTVEQPKAVSRMRSVYPLGRLRDNRRRPPRPRRSRADRRRSAAAPCARQAPLADANSRDSSVANATNAVSPRGLHAAWQQRPAIRRRQPRPRSSPKHPSLASRFSCRNLATLFEDAPPVAVRTVTEVPSIDTLYVTVRGNTGLEIRNRPRKHGPGNTGRLTRTRAFAAVSGEVYAPSFEEGNRPTRHGWRIRGESRRLAA